MGSRRTNDIEALLERLRSLKISEKTSSKNEWTETTMSTAPAATNENEQTRMPKSMILEPG